MNPFETTTREYLMLEELNADTKKLYDNLASEEIQEMRMDILKEIDTFELNQVLLYNLSIISNGMFGENLVDHADPPRFHMELTILSLLITLKEREKNLMVN